MRGDAYLCHAHPNLDAFRLRSLRSAQISGGDLFDRAMMQEYEQHLIGLGVKTGTKKERFHPYKKKKGRGGHQCQHAQQGVFYQPMPAPQYMVQQPFFATHRVGAEEDVATEEDGAAEATHQPQSSSNLFNDTQQSVLPPPQPGIRPKTLSENHWDYPQGCVQLNPNKSLSASTLQERVKTPCVQSPQEREKTPRVQSQSVCIPVQDVKFPSQKLELAPVGCRLRRFLPSGRNKKLTSQSCL